MHPAIAIDGPAASGKSTVAKLIADRLGYTFINTGAKNSRASRSTTTFPPSRPFRKCAPCWWNGSGNTTAGNLS